MHHIRPYRLFEKLTGDREVLYRIPEVRGEESKTIFALETLILVAAARITNSQSILEIGTSWGYNAFHLARNTSAMVTTVDIQGKLAYAWSEEPCEERIRTIIDNSRNLPEMSRDMIFIDGDHSHAAVKADSEYALRNANKVVGWHDYSDIQLGTKHYLDELSRTRDLYHIEDSWIVLWFKEGF